jgi:hypothetical protein
LEGRGYANLTILIRFFYVLYKNSKIILILTPALTQLQCVDGALELFTLSIVTLFAPTMFYLCPPCPLYLPIAKARGRAIQKEKRVKKNERENHTKLENYYSLGTKY